MEGRKGIHAARLGRRMSVVVAVWEVVFHG